MNDAQQIRSCVRLATTFIVPSPARYERTPEVGQIKSSFKAAGLPWHRSVLTQLQRHKTQAMSCLQTAFMHVSNWLHSKKKSTSEHHFWCFRLSQIENSIQYLEGPNGIWKDHDRQIRVPGDNNYIIIDLDGWYCMRCSSLTWSNIVWSHA